MPPVTLVKRGAYYDSVALLMLARALRARAGVQEAAVVMGTPANHDLLAQASLLTPDARTASANDLVVVVDADTSAIAEEAVAAVEPLLARRAPPDDGGRQARPRTLRVAAGRMPEANLALISVPGAFAAAEARVALDSGLHVMLFSDNVGVGEEIV